MAQEGMKYESIEDLTQELHDAVVDLPQVQLDGTRLTLTGTRIQYHKKWSFPIRQRVEFKLIFYGVESFTLEDEAQVGTLPISHFTRDEKSQITTVVGNIPVALSVYTSENGATLVIRNSEPTD
ncbi:hypothetical protein OG607_08125 [Streptomyces sp. NBC_01537]|uniref:hypothetical protein n=1 Tax=Streptomyces sp. NBC_01537 TaxID=2903896 RepID=UPI003866B2A6